MTAALLCGTVAAASDSKSTPVLSAGQIFEKAQDHYAALSSYSDEGRIITVMDSAAITTEFTTRMARPGFYRIEWDQYSDGPDSNFHTGMQGAWSFGDRDFTQMEGEGMQMLSGRDIALANVATSSGGAVANIPKIFFGAQITAQPYGLILDLRRLSDDKVGNMDCYLLMGESASGQTNTFWIGKQDFLIHQIRTEASPQTMRAAAAGTLLRLLEPAAFHGFSSTETYTNIMVNRQFSTADFAPSFVLFRR